MKISKKMGIQIFVALLFGLLNGAGINLFLSPANLYGWTDVNKVDTKIDTI